MTTSNEKRTPGPWQWMKGAERGWRLHAVEPGKPSTLIMISGSRNGSLKDVPNLDNARLIAAAPELLAALVTLTNRVSGSFYDKSQDGDNDPIMQAVGKEIDKARAAIARARG